VRDHAEFAALAIGAAAVAAWAWFQPVTQPTADSAAGPPATVSTPCPEAGGIPVTEAQLTFPAPRLDAEQAAALQALAALSQPLPCGTVAGAADAGHQGHGDGDGDAEGPSASDESLTGAPAAQLRRQWDAAQSAAGELATPEQAAAAGYVQSSPQAAGVGTHWINWQLVDAPFDPARPSMLLFDERPGRDDRLAGFSYWTRDPTGPPEGFAGDGDVWHGHVGLCFVDGWLFREGIPSADGCSGDWLDGTDLWMLHAWVVPGFGNPAGDFAGRHDGLCPADREQIADALRCDPVGD